MKPRTLSAKSFKPLFARSGNECAFPGCNHRLFDDQGLSIAEICYIKAASPAGPRFDNTQTNEERNSSRNLIILCPRHHREIDNYKKYPVETLLKMKREHERPFMEQGKQFSKFKNIEVNLPKDNAEEVPSGFHQVNSETVPSGMLQVIHNTGTIINQNANGSNNTQTATQTGFSDEISELLQSIKQEIIDHVEETKAQEKALEVLKEIEAQLKKEKPSKQIVTILINSLPTVGSILTLSNQLLSCFGAA